MEAQKRGKPQEAEVCGQGAEAGGRARPWHQNPALWHDAGSAAELGDEENSDIGGAGRLRHGPSMSQLCHSA